MSDKNNFSEFTRKYALSKTLRFELVPQGETLSHIISSGTLGRDKEKDEAYKKVKPLFDSLHEKFIEESLAQVSMNWDEYKKQFDIIQKTQEREMKLKLIKELEKVEKSLRNEVVSYFSKTGDIWARKVNTKNSKDTEESEEEGEKKEKKLGIKVLFTKPVLQLLKEKNIGNDEMLAEIEKFDNFFTYFTGFNQNRENYYSSEEKATAIPHRIVNENLPKFCSNVFNYEAKKDLYNEIYSFLKEKSIDLVATDKHTLQDIDSSKFSIQYFNQVLSQSQIENYNEYIGDINFCINLYNQQKQNEDKGYKKLPLFKILFKQIGCGKKDALFFSINSDIEMTDYLKTFLETSQQKNTQIRDFIAKLKEKEDFSQIYLSKKSLNTLSAKYFIGGWSLLSELFLKTNLGKYDKKSDEIKISGEYISLADIFEALESSKEETSILFKSGRKLENSDTGEWEKLFNNSKKVTFLNILIYEFKKTYSEWEISKNTLEKRLENINYKNEEYKSIIKSFCDNSLFLIQMLKYFIAKEAKVPNGMDGEFYNQLDMLLDKKEYDVFKWYDAIRNYLTQKLQSTEKLKLNFDQSTLLGGWDINKESANLGVILKDAEGKEYLAITNKKNNFSFDGVKNKKLYENTGIYGWKKMNYKLLPGPNKMLPKVLFAKSNVQSPSNPKGYFSPSQEILNIRKNESFKKGDSFSREDLIIWIDFCKENIKKYPDWSIFDFDFRKSEDYEDVSKFYTDVEKQGYKLDFVPLSKEVIDEMVEKGEVYLFLIKNKDITNKESTKNKNIHTLYWKALFESLENKPKLNGEAEIFFRKKTESLATKQDKKGNSVIDKKRYDKDTFLFHVPITLNFCAKDEKINDRVNEKIVSDFENMHVIGIDRGEKHLAYYSVINTKGNIVEQGTLNIPFQNPVKKIKTDGTEIIVHDYNELLDFYASNRDEARKNWKTIGTIKELKEGYIGHAIHEVVELIKKYNALVVLEDLNTGFKRGRQKIEKSIYQKFELALAKKLNFLVEKGKSGDEAGSPTNALQLTPPVQNYQDIEAKKQVGIMLYTRANYTSTTDPVTGWRKNVYLKKGGIEDIKDQIKNFKEIRYDTKQKAYYFVYNPKDFSGNKALAKDWKIWSSVDRYRGQKNNQGIWEIQKLDITRDLDTLFSGCDKNRDLREQIIEEGIELKKFTEHTAWETLLYSINLIMQIRNTSSSGEDFLQSPVQDKKTGEQYDSRKWLAKNNGSEMKNSLELPVSGDANGAFNIARKGLMMMGNIKKKPEKLELYISDIDWDNFTQNQ